MAFRGDVPSFTMKHELTARPNCTEKNDSYLLNQTLGLRTSHMRHSCRFPIGSHASDDAQVIHDVTADRYSGNQPLFGLVQTR
jgi:hypothetical protein